MGERSRDGKRPRAAVALRPRNMMGALTPSLVALPVCGLVARFPLLLQFQYRLLFLPVDSLTRAPTRLSRATSGP